MKIDINKTAVQNLYDLIALNNYFLKDSFSAENFTLGLPFPYTDPNGVYNTNVKATSVQDSGTLGERMVKYHRLILDDFIHVNIPMVDGWTVADIKNALCLALELLPSEITIELTNAPQAGDFDTNGELLVVFSAVSNSYLYIGSGLFTLTA